MWPTFSFVQHSRQVKGIFPPSPPHFPHFLHYLVVSPSPLLGHCANTLICLEFKVEWYPMYGPKSLFKFGEKRPIVCCCTHEQKMNFEGFTQNGCYGNQSQPLEILVDSTDANNPCPFTKQDLIFKQAYLVGFCFVLFNKLKF